MSAHNPWGTRLAAVRRDPAGLIALAREINQHQANQAWEDWGNYSLIRHHETRKPIGLLKQGKELREVYRPYDRPYWQCMSEFGRQVIAPCNQSLWSLAKRPEWTTEAEAAYVVPKHGYIMRILLEIERGLRDATTGEEKKG